MKEAKGQAACPPAGQPAGQKDRDQRIGGRLAKGRGWSPSQADLGRGRRAAGAGEDYAERTRLHDAFTQTIFTLEEKAAAKESYKVAFPAAARSIEEVVKELSKAPACVPPCGFQEMARLFFCNSCAAHDCDLPLECPIRDLLVPVGGQAAFSCSVSFSTPSELTYTWLFAGNIRTKDLSYFRVMPRAQDEFARIRPVRPPHRGTFSCLLSSDEQPLARLFFFLNVTSGKAQNETELQTLFRAVLKAKGSKADCPEPWQPSFSTLLAHPGALTLRNLCLLGLAAGLGTTSFIVLGMLLYRYSEESPLHPLASITPIKIFLGSLRSRSKVTVSRPKDKAPTTY
uniref:Sperm acrosome membrane-associated protein 6 isoform X2 n=1 Tax=Phascolarctos cinereus TaxID=38626 RepID=A0A6P5LS70_PHACI|nr:sperm acrosome membrane-associated protein 6 isoform X2 [Phascolarctos cinereus]